MNRPGGTLPEVIVKVSTAPLLVSRQTPWINVPPLVSGEQSRLSEADWAAAGPAVARPAASAPAAATVAKVFLMTPPCGGPCSGRSWITGSEQLPEIGMAELGYYPAPNNGSAGQPVQPAWSFPPVCRCP